MIPTRFPRWPVLAASFLLIAYGDAASAAKRPGRTVSTSHDVSRPEVNPSMDIVFSRASAIIAEALKVPNGYKRLATLTDTIGARLAGSEAEPKAVAWAKAEFEKDGVAAHLEAVMVPAWVRGHEEAEIVSPAHQRLVILGLGGTVGTPPDAITASVIVVSSYEQLLAAGKEGVAGKIVLYDNAFVRTGDEGRDYGNAVKFRSGGASEAAKLGAVATLVRSVATASLRTPHTGGLSYLEDVPKIPVAAVTIEDALLIHRLVEAGREVRVRLYLGARQEPDRRGANVVGEIRGRERPEEIVLIGAHLDSWDVGAGAIDDGAGCAMVLETMRLIAAGPPPRRTVRAVLFANEENGLAGGKAYRDAHKNELPKHVAAIEADSGAGRAVGFEIQLESEGDEKSPQKRPAPGVVEADVNAGDSRLLMLRDLLTGVLAPIGAARTRAGHGGADISVLADFGVPLISLDQDTTHYFDWHHTMADTLDKIEPAELQHAAAALAAATWVLADSPRMLPRLPIKPPKSP